MKKNSILPIIIASSFLFAGAASAGSTHNNETDLIYGNGNVIFDQSEIYASGSLMQSNKSTDLIYSEHETQSSQGKAPERHCQDDLCYIRPSKISR